MAKNRGTPSKIPIFSYALHTNDGGPALLLSALCARFLAMESGGDANVVLRAGFGVGASRFVVTGSGCWLLGRDSPSSPGQLDSRSGPGCDRSLQDQLDEAIM